jgi:hypothetical protein
MALKIIGAGFGRTGTASLYAAFNQLGFPCYHMFEVLRNKRNKSHLGFWLEVADGAPGASHNWERVFANYSAAVDNPACCVWRELLAAYPEAKVVLTLHPKGAQTWYESTMETIYFTETGWQFQILKALTPFGRRFGRMSQRLIWQRSHGGTMSDRDRAIAHYQQHVEAVKAAVPPERLLVFSVDQGWAPLCAFLGIPVPATPFPRINDRAEFKHILDGMNRGAYVILAALAALAVGLAYGAARLLG